MKTLQLKKLIFLIPNLKPSLPQFTMFRVLLYLGSRSYDKKLAIWKAGQEGSHFLFLQTLSSKWLWIYLTISLKNKGSLWKPLLSLVKPSPFIMGFALPILLFLLITPGWINEKKEVHTLQEVGEYTVITNLNDILEEFLQR